jgi:hypothetical protein
MLRKIINENIVQLKKLNSFGVWNIQDFLSESIHDYLDENYRDFEGINIEEKSVQVYYLNKFKEELKRIVDNIKTEDVFY